MPATTTNKKATMTLLGVDGNAFAVMAAFTRAARLQGWGAADIRAVLDECMTGDYNHLLRVIMDHTVELPEDRE